MMQAKVNRKSGESYPHLSSILQAAKEDLGLAVAVGKDSGSVLLASSAEF